MTELHRRHVISAGAALTFAGCAMASAPGAGERSASENKHERSVKMFGPGYRHGDAAEKPKVEPTNLFVPEYICVVYISLAAGNGLVIRHGYEKVTSAESHDETAKALLQAARRANNATWKHAAAEKYKRREIGFDHFTFGSRQKIYIFVDEKADNLKFDERNGKQTIVRFSPYSGTNYGAGPVMKENYAFYDLDVRDFSIVGGQQRRLVTLNYWNTDEKGDQIVPDPNDSNSWYIYAMNIHLLMSAGSRGLGDPLRMIPVIIDPDTGNMGSKP